MVKYHVHDSVAPARGGVPDAMNLRRIGEFAVRTRTARIHSVTHSVAMALAIAGCLGAASGRAAAADTTPSTAAESTELQEITVTATRRRETTVDTPIAIDAFSGSTLKNYGVDSLQDLHKVDASVTVNNFGATQQQIVIRGISSNIAATTGLYLDESPLLGGFQNNFRGDGTPGIRLIDVDRVEVLKGPQGTLFGSGSMDGTLRIISRKPDLDSWGGAFTAEGAIITGGDPFFDGNAVLNAPIVKDTLGVRLVAWGEAGGGFIDQKLNPTTTLENVNEVNLKGFRGTALWQPITDLKIDASFNYQNTDVTGVQFWNASSTVVSQATPAPLVNTEPSRQPYHDNYMLYNVTADYDLHVGEVIAVFTHGTKYTVQPFDSTPTNCSFGLCPPFLPPLQFVPELTFADTTAELRYVSKLSGPVQFVAGGYYEKDNSTFNGSAVYNDPDGYVACIDLAQCEERGLRKPGNNFAGGLPANVLEFGTIDRTEVSQYAFYAQADWKIVDPLTLTLGARYFSADIKDRTYSTQDIAPPNACNWVFGCVTPPYITFDGSEKQSKTTYNIALLYKLTTDVNLYVRAASGFRIGGINTDYNPANLPQVPLGYEPDQLWDYEGGIKAYFLNRSLYMDFAIYHLDWTNQHINAIANGAFEYTLNAGKTTTDGFEFDLNYLITRGLTVNAAVSYNDAKLAETLPPAVTAAGNGGNKGDPLPLSPRWVAAAGLNYEFPLNDQVRGYATTSVSYRDAMQIGFNPTDQYYGKVPPYTLADLKVGMRWSHWDLGLFVRNVGNTVAWTGLYLSQDGTRVYSPPPRTVGISFSGSF